MGNPYIHRAPVGGREGFCNRASELMRVCSRIAAERPQSISVVGPPRTGKTSLLNYLLDPATQREVLDDPGRYLLVRLPLAEDPPRDQDAFYARLAAGLEAGGASRPGPGHEGFSRAVKQLMGQGRKLLLFLDDFGEVTKNDRFTVDFFSFMRSVANGHDVGYLTTSWAPLQKLCHTQDLEDSPFFNIFTTVNLEPFKPEAARELVEGPARAAGQPFGEEVEWILQLGGPSPYLLQLAAAIAYERRGQGALAREELAQAALREAREHLATTWEDHLTDTQREVLKAVAAGKAVPPRHQYAAEALERRGIIRPAGEGHAFADELTERFVRAQGSGLWRRLFG